MLYSTQTVPNCLPVHSAIPTHRLEVCVLCVDHQLHVCAHGSCRQLGHTPQQRLSQRHLLTRQRDSNQRVRQARARACGKDKQVEKS
jgi:hypothetical protein